MVATWLPVALVAAFTLWLAIALGDKSHFWDLNLGMAIVNSLLTVMATWMGLVWLIGFFKVQKKSPQWSKTYLLVVFLLWIQIGIAVLMLWNLAAYFTQSLIPPIAVPGLPGTRSFMALYLCQQTVYMTFLRVCVIALQRKELSIPPLDESKTDA